MKKIFLIFLIIVMLFFTSACFLFDCANNNKVYTGEYKDLYSVAINTLLWTKGHSNGAEFPTESRVKLLETDSFGRKLFLYEEAYFDLGGISFSSLLICQKSDKEKVYFYENINFISKEREAYYGTIDFSENEILALKQQNDWEKELNLEKCVIKEQRNSKKAIEVNDSTIKEALQTIDGYKEHKSFYYLTSDKNGKFICYGQVTVNDEKAYVAILFNSDLTINDESSVFISQNHYSYQEDFARYKELNNWNG